MRKIYLLLSFSFLFMNAANAADKVIELSKPDMNRATTVMKALSDRKSTREYAAKDLSVADLSDLLWAANGINRPAENKRTAPSAMNRQDVDVYVIMKQGAYLYDAKNHKLNLVAEGDFRGDVASGQDFAKTAPVSLVLVSDLAKMGDPKNLQTLTMCSVDVGIVSQNISIFCSAANLATVARGTMNKDNLKTALKLKDSQMPIINHPVGHFK